MKNLFLSLLVLSVIGCSTATEKCTDVNQDRVYQILSAGYDAGSDTTSASAQLRFGDGTGTTLEFTGLCAVSHSHYTLTKSALSDLLGTAYYGSGTGKKTDHSFTFTDANGKTFTNSGTLPTIELSSPPSTISKAASKEISWSGGALEDNETVTAYISAETRDGETPSQSSFTTASTSTKGATSVTFTKNDLKDLSTGAKKLYLRRTKTVSMAEKTSAGGTMSAS